MSPKESGVCGGDRSSLSPAPVGAGLPGHAHPGKLPHGDTLGDRTGDKGNRFFGSQDSDMGRFK